MEKKASEIQKERIREIENKANALLKECNVVTLASITQEGYPRICTISKMLDNGFKEIYFQTSKRSEYKGKATHFETNSKASVSYSMENNSVTLIGEVIVIKDIETIKKYEEYCDKRFFKKGIEDPKYRLLRFSTLEATFWIDGKFRTCKYKKGNK